MINDNFQKYHESILAYENIINSTVQLFIKFKSVLLNHLINVFGNHVCTLVKEGNLYYVYDPTNLCVFKLDDFLQANVIGGTGNIDIKPYWLSLFCGLDNIKIVEIIDSYKNIESKIKTDDFIEIKSSFESSIELCMKNISLFNDFYDENENDRNKVLTIFRDKK